VQANLQKRNVKQE